MSDERIEKKENLIADEAANDDEVEIDLGELFYFYRSHLVSIILVFILGALAAGAIAFYLVTPKYTATSKLYMVSSSTKSVVDISDFNIGTSLSQDYVEVLKTRPVYESVIDKLHLDYNYRQLSKMIKTSVVGDTRIVQIDVTDTNPKEARDIANAVADAAVEQVPRTMETSEPHIIEPAIVPDEQSSPHLLIDIVAGGLAGLVIMLVMLTVSFISDDTFQSGEDVEKMFGVMPLTVIPESDLGILNEKNESDDDDKANRRRAKAMAKNRKANERARARSMKKAARRRR
ncbi:MAG: Wzz/FepE/Etk N-terminal domain-containing protein [Lachnospiraceae bacterium]|nr:Wzz/FepE/Etk N-terminal domain-containing protein [Lachnospiraceae bacterium]